MLSTDFHGERGQLARILGRTSFAQAAPYIQESHRYSPPLKWARAPPSSDGMRALPPGGSSGDKPRPRRALHPWVWSLDPARNFLSADLRDTAQQLACLPSSSEVQLESLGGRGPEQEQPAHPLPDRHPPAHPSPHPPLPLEEAQPLGRPHWPPLPQLPTRPHWPLLFPVASPTSSWASVPSPPWAAA